MEGQGLLYGAMENLLKKVRSVDPESSELERLDFMLRYIQDVIQTAEGGYEIPRHWIKAVLDAAYEAEDIFDELLIEYGRSETRKVSLSIFHRLFDFNKKQKLVWAVNRISKKVTVLADDITRFGFEVKAKPYPDRRREETTSFVSEGDVIGREDEVKVIVNMLLDANFDEGFPVVCIVGIGGLGKTAVAQLVYNHRRVIEAFPSRFWVCVSDTGRSKPDVSAILGKIRHIASNFKYPLHDSISTPELQASIRELLQGNKSLLVLDDLWCEDICLLHSLLITSGRSGSRILVTTRSAKTADVLKSHIFELQGLSQENSWQLFSSVVFSRYWEPPTDLVQIGRKIVSQCSNHPLAIRVVGSILYGESKSKWLSMLDNVVEFPSEISDILRLSYYALKPSLRSCFAYCALFPKGFEIHKELLISLWMANGYLGHDFGAAPDDRGEQCFSILLQRSFFTEVKRDEYGESISCKLHDLMHDLAQVAAANEISVVNSLKRSFDPNIHHIFQAGGEFEGLLINTKVRSYLQHGLTCRFSLNIELNSSMRLRVLDLHNLGIKSLPHSIGALKHLRYLDLSENGAITLLPRSITKLYNLQTLILKDCVKLNELPKRFSDLLSLRYLDVYNCGLTHMPSDMNKLTCLRVLTGFVVAERDSIRKQSAGQLQDIRALVNLKGCLDISIPYNAEIADNYSKEGYVSSMGDMKQISVKFKASHPTEYSDDTRTMHKVWMEMLHPHSNLLGFMLYSYQGDRIFGCRTQDNWATLLPNLIKIELVSCRWLKQIPLLSELYHLRSLVLDELTSLEYMEDENSWSPETSGSRSSNIMPLNFFPSLKSLCISNMPELKGWWRGVGWGDKQVDCSKSMQPRFPHLSELIIRICPKLTSFPLCPHLDTLNLSELNEKLHIIAGKPAMELVELDSIHHLKSLSMNCLVKLHIRGALELKSLSEVGDVFRSCSSLRNLTIEDCPNLSHLSGGLEHLTDLEPDEVDKNDSLWKSLQQSLCVLKLKNLSNLSNLPCGMQYLTALQTLIIDNCGLKCLPDWIGSLSSLQRLHIISCFYLKSLPEEMRKLIYLEKLEIKGSWELYERCREIDWPIIQFIPDISLSYK